MTKIQSIIARALASADLVKSENSRRERADSTERVTLRSELNAAAEALCDGAYLETLPEGLRKRWAIEAAHEALENACDIAENADCFEDELAGIVMRLRELKRLKAEDEKRSAIASRRSRFSKSATRTLSKTRLSMSMTINPPALFAQKWASAVS